MGYTAAMPTQDTERIAPPAEPAQSRAPVAVPVRPHRIIWSIALAVLLCCAAILAVQSVYQNRNVLSRDPEFALREAMDHLDGDPSMAEAETQRRVRLAAVLAETGAVESATGDYLLALQYRSELNLNGSETLFKRAISRQPNWSRPHAGLGALLGRHGAGRVEEAERELRRAIELDPEWHQPWDDLAVTLRIAGRPEEAEEAARTAVILAPGAVAPHNNLANLLVELGHYREAEEYFLEAIKLRPEHPKPWYNLACLYSLLERNGEAIEHLRAAIQRAAVLRNEAASDPDFDPIRDDPAFQELVYGFGDSSATVPAESP